MEQRRGYRGFAFQSRRASAGLASARIPSAPKRGYGVRPGMNKPLPGSWATPEFAARNAEDHWTIFDWETGKTVGTGADFRRRDDGYDDGPFYVLPENEG